MARSVEFAKRFYRERFGNEAPCQICGIGTDATDGCHKLRRWKFPPGHGLGQGEHPSNIVLGHRRCHQWTALFPGAEEYMAKSNVSCEEGGVIVWPDGWKISLICYKNTGYFSRREAEKLIDKASKRL